jgi:hypothetical protein
MPYIGRSENFGVRSRFQYQATAGQTSFSGSDANSLSLSYTDSSVHGCVSEWYLACSGR